MIPEALYEIGWILLAFGAGLGARALRMPPLVGYLLTGMGLATVGYSGGATIEQLGELGVTLLLFIVGLDLRWKNIVQPEVLGAGSLHVLAIGLAGTLGGYLLGLPVLAAAAVGLSLTVSSLVLAAKALEMQGDERAYHGRVAVGIILLQTVIVTAALGAVGPTPSVWAPLLVLGVLARPALRALLDRIDSAELLLFFGLSAAVSGYLLFESVSVSGDLGALAVGALLAGHERADDVAERLAPLKDVLLAAFFLSVGLVGLPSGTGLLVAGALLVFLAFKAAVLFGCLVQFRLTARTAFFTTMPLVTFSGFTLIMGDAVVQAGSMAASVLTVLAVATALSYMLNAVLARYTLDLWRYVGAYLKRLERTGRHPDALPQTLGHAHFLVVGMDRVGTAAYDRLGAEMRCVVGLDSDPERIAAHRKAGRRVVYGDARSRMLWQSIDLHALDAVLLTLSDQATKVEIIRALRQAGFEGGISALTTDPSDQDALLEAGANSVCISVEQAGRALANYGMARGKSATPDAVTIRLDEDAPAQPSG